MAAVLNHYNPINSMHMGVDVSCEKKVLSPQTVLDIVESLQYGGFEEVQQKYGAGKDHRPTLKDNAYAELPVIDLSRAAAESDVVSKELGDAAAQWGMFQIVNHGIPLETLQDIEAQGLQFFKYPTERKLKCGRGYTPISADEPDSSLHWAEMMMISPCPYCERVKSSLEDALSVIWPEGNAELRNALTVFQTGLEQINRRVLQLIAQYLGLEKNTFSQLFEADKSPTYTLRWNYYPTFPSPSEVLGANDHTDPVSLTILMQDKVGGLQIRRDGQWYGVKPIEGALVVNIGDCLHAWTNSRLKSVYHRVVVNKEVDRISMVVFVNPEMRVAISAADELIDEDHPRIYKPFLFKEFVEKLMDARYSPREPGTPVNDGVRILDHFKIQN